MALILHQVDAFTDRPFGGNPAAVCVLDRPRSEAFMRRVAREMNLSETAFLEPRGEAFALRWFTPEVEVDLCGHATLASAHVLWEAGHLPHHAAARFTTRSGPLTAWREGAFIRMDFPSRPAQACDAPEGLGEALGVSPRWVGRSADDVLVEVDDEAAVLAASPDFGALRRVKARGIVLTARAADPELDFVSRFFAPTCGIDEDPVTGSAHCTLAPFWAPRLGKQALRAAQRSRRGGLIDVELRGDRVLLGGQAITVMEARLLVDEPAAGEGV